MRRQMAYALGEALTAAKNATAQGAGGNNHNMSCTRRSCAQAAGTGA